MITNKFCSCYLKLRERDVFGNLTGQNFNYTTSKIAIRVTHNDNLTNDSISMLIDFLVYKRSSSIEQGDANLEESGSDL